MTRPLKHIARVEKQITEDTHCKVILTLLAITCFAVLLVVAYH